jgi:thioredoxin-related protein
MKFVMKKLVIVLFFTTGISSFSQVQFQKGTLNDMFSIAKEQNKVLMVDVLTEWCKWCIELDNKVYARQDIGNFANANQINYKIDAEKGEGVEFAKKYKVTGYPTILFLDGEGNEIDRIIGYYPAKDFLEMMTDYNKGINTFSYLKEVLEKNPEDIDANLKIADKYLQLGDYANSVKHLSIILRVDSANINGKTDDAKLKLISLTEELFKNTQLYVDEIKEAYKKFVISLKAEALNNFITNNPDSDVLKDAYLSISESYFYELNDLENSEKYYKQTLSLYPDDDMVKLSYGQFLNSRANGLSESGNNADDYEKGLSLIEAALPFVMGSVNEASSYYIQSKLLFKLEKYDEALESINKALKIFDRKLYQDHKEKVEKQMSSR